MEHGFFKANDLAKLRQQQLAKRMSPIFTVSFPSLKFFIQAAPGCNLPLKSLFFIESNNQSPA